MLELQERRPERPATVSGLGSGPRADFSPRRRPPAGRSGRALFTDAQQRRLAGVNLVTAVII